VLNRQKRRFPARAVQLALNALAMLNVAHIGCAGFNKVLGPWRPCI
jgi:hypothetical protein